MSAALRPPTAAGQDASHASPELIRFEVLGGTGEGLDRDRRRNLLQLGIAVAFVFAGAVAGYNATEDAPWIAAACGGVVGLIAGTVVGGLVLFAVDRGPTRWTFEEYLAQRLQSRRRTRWAIIAFVANVVLGALFVPILANDDAPWAFVICILWMMAWVGMCAYAKSARYVSLLLRCPDCGHAAEVGSEGRCPDCGSRLS